MTLSEIQQFIQTWLEWPVDITWHGVKWREGLFGGQSGRERGHGDLLWCVLHHAGPPPRPQLLHPLDPEQEPLLVAEHEEPDVLKVLDGDGEDVFDGVVSLGVEGAGVLGEVQREHHLLHGLGRALGQPVRQTQLLYFRLEFLPVMRLLYPNGRQVLGGPAILIFKQLTDSIIITWFIFYF